jgi:membrane-bound serine protease (ClpP class)
MFYRRVGGDQLGAARVPRRWLALAAALFVLVGLSIGIMPAGAEGEVVAAARDGGQGTASSLAGMLTMPLVAGLLFALGVLLIVGEFLTAQFTGLGIVGLGALALVFWGHYVAGSAGWLGLGLIALGIVLLAAELFALPGFGVAGVAGLAALLGGLFVTVAGAENPTRDTLGRGLTATGVALVGFVAGGATLLWALPRLAARRGLVLQATVDQLMPALTLSAAGGGGETAMPFDGLVAERLQSLTGATGEALSDLRPGGFALIDGQRVDVITRGEVIPRGARIQVVADEGYRRIVRRLEPDEREPATL